MNIRENVHRQQWKRVKFFLRLALSQRYPVFFVIIRFLTMFGRSSVGHVSSFSHSRIDHVPPGVAV